MQHLFLIAPIAKILWGQLVNYARIQVKEDLKHMIWSCWEAEAPLK